MTDLSALEEKAKKVQTLLLTQLTCGTESISFVFLLPDKVAESNFSIQIFTWQSHFHA